MPRIPFLRALEGLFARESGRPLPCLGRSASARVAASARAREPFGPALYALLRGVADDSLASSTRRVYSSHVSFFHEFMTLLGLDFSSFGLPVAQGGFTRGDASGAVDRFGLFPPFALSPRSPSYPRRSRAPVRLCSGRLVSRSAPLPSSASRSHTPVRLRSGWSGPGAPPLGGFCPQTLPAFAPCFRAPVRLRPGGPGPCRCALAWRVRSGSGALCLCFSFPNTSAATLWLVRSRCASARRARSGSPCLCPPLPNTSAATLWLVRSRCAKARLAVPLWLLGSPLSSPEDALVF